MQNKIVIVTGATQGIGEISALKLAEQGATVVLISRSQSKLDKTIAEIKSKTSNQNLHGIQADLSSLADIHKAAKSFLEMFNRLDVLVNNAGALFTNRHESVDGNEMTFALNHLNYFLLTHLLLDTLKQTAETQGEARIVNVSSDAHYGKKVDFEDLQRTRLFNPFDVYGDSKLMNILFTFELARRLEGSNVSANTLHPGFVNTGFGENNGGVFKWIIAGIKNVVAISPEKGAETMVYLASSPEIQGISGKYWEKKQIKNPDKAANDVAAQKRLWDISEKLVGLS